MVSTLELSLSLCVIGLVNEGASPNRKLFNLHTELVDDPNCDVVFKTINLFATSQRFIYFFADSPHLMKTARNCLYNPDLVHAVVSCGMMVAICYSDT